MKIGIVATGNRLNRELADTLTTIVQSFENGMRPAIVVHPQCFASSGHFAGDDTTRAEAFLEFANDPSIDAIWFAKGGYGSARLLRFVIPELNEAARHKTYLGYSDAGALLAGLYKEGCESVLHGPMVTDLTRSGGEAAIKRTLAYLTQQNSKSLEPTLREGLKYAAFNLTTLSHMIGTPYVPDLSGHVLMIEEIAEHMYRIDRYLCHLSNSGLLSTLSGLQLGRCSLIPDNDPDFQLSEVEVARHWCEVSGIRYLGRADIGHDADNKIVPFGTFSTELAT